ncbi:hypothetical protein SAMN05216597_0775 [Pseudomonas cannabina]|nr:hypothetical protein SAMN05216597_0775 [Pseudomonas cannabina]
MLIQFGAALTLNTWRLIWPSEQYRSLVRNRLVIPALDLEYAKPYLSRG